jgi:hypothetical protein
VDSAFLEVTPHVVERDTSLVPILGQCEDRGPFAATQRRELDSCDLSALAIKQSGRMRRDQTRDGIFSAASAADHPQFLDSFRRWTPDG